MGQHLKPGLLLNSPRHPFIEFNADGAPIQPRGLRQNRPPAAPIIYEHPTFHFLQQSDYPASVSGAVVRRLDYEATLIIGPVHMTQRLPVRHWIAIQRATKQTFDVGELFALIESGTDP